MYFYRLGHIPSLGLSEFATVIGKKNIDSFDNLFLKSSNNINVNNFGSLVFRAKIIQQITHENLESDLKIIISNYIKESGIKKWGLNIHKKYQKDLLKSAKNAGAKKVNITFKNDLNFGDVKQSKNWIQLIYFKNEIFITHLDNFSNQEFWSKIDYTLPHNDLKRGIINLKLARSLFNLANNPKQWWDPFVGQSRMLVANLDKTDSFLGSDLEENVLNEAKDNIEFSQNYFKWNQKFLGNDNEFKNPEVIFFHQDVKEKISLNSLENKGVDFKNINTIITEGYLGRTLYSHPNEMRAKEEIKVVANIWKDALKNFEELGIKNIVACLPFYPQVSQLNKKYYNQILKEIIKDSKADFKIDPFFEEEIFIPYSRKESFTGHLIFRLKK